MIGKISSYQDRVKISYALESDQFDGKLQQVKFEKQKATVLSKSNREDSCMLQIYDHTEEKPQGNGLLSFDVTYSCYSSIKSLQQILQQELNDEQKMLYFYKLMQLAINHKSQKITHFNIKPSNVILYKDRFYLINFGYLNDKPSEFVINLNYFQYEDNDNEHKRNVFPYLNDEFLSQLKENKNGLNQKLLKMSKVDILNYDRYALEVMMLELFVPLEIIYDNKFDIDTCIEKAKNMEKQLGNINDCQENNGKNVVKQIQQIIHDILQKNQLPSEKLVKELHQYLEEYQNYLQPKKKIQRQLNQNLSLSYVNESEGDGLMDKIQGIPQSEITLLDKMTSENYAYVTNLTSKNILQFDPNLLYYLNKKDLQSYLNNIQNSHLDNMKSKAKDILKLYYNGFQYKQAYQDLDIESKYYYLKNTLTNDNDYYEFNIQDQIEELNKIDPKNFKFNQINKGLTQEKEQTEIPFEQILQHKIPNIMRFLEYQSLLKQNQNNKKFNYEFEQIQCQNTNFYSAKLKNSNEFWTLFEKTEKQETQKKLFIGQIRADRDQQFEGRVIEEIKYQILDYEKVIYDFGKDENFGMDVKVSIYIKSNFDLILFYQGGLEGNKYDGEGFIKDWKNNYEYKGKWKQGKKDGKGKLKILNTEVLHQNEYSELDEVEYSDDYLKYGRTPKIMVQENKILEIKCYGYEAMQVYKLEDKCNHKCDDKCNGICQHKCDDKCGGKRNPKYFIKFDCSKLCKKIESKLADSLHSIKNSLCKCKKTR